MKKQLRIAVCLLIVYYKSLGVFAQQPSGSANAMVFADIVSPVEVSEVHSLRFKNEKTSSARSPSIIISPTANLNSETNEERLPETGNNCQAASFTIVSDLNSAYIITLQSRPLYLTNTQHDTLVLDNFTESVIVNHVSPGMQTINVGCTLKINEAQPKGYYTSGIAFEITFDYN